MLMCLRVPYVHFAEGFQPSLVLLLIHFSWQLCTWTPLCIMDLLWGRLTFFHIWTSWANTTWKDCLCLKQCMTARIRVRVKETNLFQFSFVKLLFPYSSSSASARGPFSFSVKTTAASSAIVNEPSLFRSKPFRNWFSLTANAGTYKNKMDTLFESDFNYSKDFVLAVDFESNKCTYGFDFFISKSTIFWVNIIHLKCF